MFENAQWEATLHEERCTIDGRDVGLVWWTISETPFTFEAWTQEAGFEVELQPPAAIYTHCAANLGIGACKELVAEAQTRLEVSPGCLRPFEKAASHYVLRLLASIPYKKVWKAWARIPVTNDMLKDEIFCLAVVALHPELYGKLHPIGRNKKRVCLEAAMAWRLPKFSMLQFTHPGTLLSFRGRPVAQSDIGYDLQAHTGDQYWAFDDIEIVLLIVGKPGKRRWFELEFAGPTAVNAILGDRERNGHSVAVALPYVKRNHYCRGPL